MSDDTTWFWTIVDAHGLANVSSDEIVALREILDRAEAAEARVTALEAENKRITSDREYVIGFNAGWDEAVAQTLRFPTMLRKMWSGGEVQKWIDEAMTAARQALSPSTEVKNDAGA
jgi:hypothetical protein